MSIRIPPAPRAVSLAHAIAPHWNWRGEALRREPPDALAETGVDWPKHGFTHVDAPCHILHRGRTLDDCGLDQLCGEAAVVDVSDRVPAKPVTREILEARGGGVRAGDILVLRADLHRRFPHHSDDYWRNSPWLDAGGSRWVVERGCKALAVDFPQDWCARELNHRAVPNEEFTEHRIVLGGGLMHLEHLAGLEAIAADRIFLLGLPLRLPGADGGPAGPVALAAWPSRAPRISDLTLPLAPTADGRVAGGLAKSFEAGDPVQETGIRVAGHSHTHVLTPRYLDPAAAGIDALRGAPLVGPADLVDLDGPPDDAPIDADRLARALPAAAGGAILALRSGFAERAAYGGADWLRRSPWLTRAAAAAISERGYRAVAADFEVDEGRKRLGSAPARESDLSAEAVLLRGGASMVKNVAGLSALRGGPAWIAVLALPLPGAESAPARVLGLQW